MSLCRGCAGSGVTIDVPPRLMQIACIPVVMGLRYGGHGVHVCARLATSEYIEHPGGYRPTRSLPLLDLLAWIAEKEGEGRLPLDPYFPLTKDHACQWCNGTGNPAGQLTVKALEVALSGARKDRR